MKNSNWVKNIHTMIVVSAYYVYSFFVTGTMHFQLSPAISFHIELYKICHIDPHVSAKPVNIIIII